MKVYLAALENGWLKKEDYEKLVPHHYILMSYYYIRKSKPNIEIFEYMLKHSKGVLLDSGAFTFMNGAKEVNWDEYVRDYKAFIQKYDCDTLDGVFELDIDVVVGYERVKEIRASLEEVTDKIIPVWHKNRGIAEYDKMCQNYKYIAFTGVRNRDIRDEHYALFVKRAKKYGAKVHCLGMTQDRFLQTIPFDSVDSSSWMQGAIRGRVGKTHFKGSKSYKELVTQGYLEGKRKQVYYENYWKKK